MRTNRKHAAPQAFEVNGSEKSAARERKAAATSVKLANLPPDIGRNRVADTATSAAFWGVSVPHFRRLYRAGKVPRPIKIGDRKLAWRIGVLADALEARERAAA